MSMGKLRLESGLSQLASSGPAFFLWRPGGKPSGQARCPVAGMPTEPCNHHPRSRTLAAQRRPLGPHGPQVAPCPLSFRSGSSETVWAAPGSSAWASEAHLPAAWVRAHALLALLRLGQAGGQGWPRGAGPVPRAVGEARAVPGGGWVAGPRH